MIGVFDSGSGGLTVLQALRAQAPNVDLLYIGDLLNAPYGNRDLREIEQLTFQMIRFLRARGTTHLVSACNSISATVIRPMLELLCVQNAGITEMVGPTADALRSFTRRRIIFFTTCATAHSNIYQRACADRGLDAHVIPLPQLAGRIEHHAPQNELRKEISGGLKQAQHLNTDLIVFGCTHYPLVRTIFEEEANRLDFPVSFFDPAHAVALQALTIHGTQGSGATELIITRESEQFRNFAAERGFAEKVNLGNL